MTLVVIMSVVAITGRLAVKASAAFEKVMIVYKIYPQDRSAFQFKGSVFIKLTRRLRAASGAGIALLVSPWLMAGNALVIQSDFGGLAMTGVAYGVSSELEIFNLNPLIPLYDIEEASNSLQYTAATWPPGTVFVSVVDPGVGTERKSVVLKTKSGHYFVSPDNGSLSGPAEKFGIEAVREIDESVNRRKGTDWSHTFHGRDVYSFTGARLAAGVITYEDVGPLQEPKVISLEKPGATLQDGIFSGTITGGTGRLGNIAFNIERHLFAEIDPVYGEPFTVVVRNKGREIWRGNLPYVRTFGDVRLGKELLFVNSSGFLSTAINQGHFASAHGIGAGRDWHVEIRRVEQ